MMELLNQMKRAAASMALQQGAPRWGLVQSTRKTDTGYQVRVTIQPEDVLSGWLPVLSPMVGAGWGLVAPPALNSQVFVIPQEGRADHGVVVGMTFSNDMMPPQPGGTPVGEGQFAIVHKNGSYLLFNDDDVIVVTSRDLTATVGRNASITAQGSVHLGAPTIACDADGKGGQATVNVTGTLNLSGTLNAGQVNASGDIHAAGTVTGHNGLS
jgi:phage baseplate assembly protein V